MMKVVWQTRFKRRLNLPNVDRAYSGKNDVRQFILVVKILGATPWLKVKEQGYCRAFRFYYSNKI